MEYIYSQTKRVASERYEMLRTVLCFHYRTNQLSNDHKTTQSFPDLFVQKIKATGKRTDE